MVDQEANKNRNIQFIFWDNSTYFEMQRLNLPMDHYEACMLVNEANYDSYDIESFGQDSSSCTNETNFFFAVMFCPDAKENTSPFRLLKF